MNMEDKIHLAALRTKDIMTLEKGYNPEYVQASKLFGSRNLFVKLRNEYLTEFCNQLDRVGILNHELQKVYSWGKPDIFINDYGFIELFFKWCGIDSEDRNRCQNYADSAYQTCVLVNFEQDPLPFIQIFSPNHPCYML
ncbi:UNVERIFIED_CONTAM: hypothetical protein RMT77_016008 [Armadillidium vulgare]